MKDIYAFAVESEMTCGETTAEIAKRSSPVCVALETNPVTVEGDDVFVEV